MNECSLSLPGNTPRRLPEITAAVALPASARAKTGTSVAALDRKVGLPMGPLPEHCSGSGRPRQNSIVGVTGTTVGVVS